PESIGPVDLARGDCHGAGDDLGSYPERCARASQRTRPSTTSAGGSRRLMLMSKLSLHNRIFKLALVLVAIFTFLGAGDESARFKDLGHRLMCVCGCSQILLECNHVGCTYSDRMRGELMAALDNGNNDDLTLQSFVQKYGTTVLAAPTKAGFNRVAWIMPYVALVLGLAMTILLVRKWKSRALPSMAGGVRPVTGPELDQFREQARRETDL